MSPNKCFFLYIVYDKKFDCTEAQANRRSWKGGNISLCSFEARPRGVRFQVNGYLRKSGNLLHVKLMDRDPQTPERQLFYVNSWMAVSVSEAFSLGGCWPVLLCGLDFR